jgi:HK97 family phage major capsid protein
MAGPRHPVAIKAETDTTFTLSGPAAVFGGEDLQGEYFDSASDFWLDRLGGPTRPLLYDHGFSKAIGDQMIGRATLTHGAEALFFEAEISKATKYADQIRALAAAGVLGASLGSAPHLVKSIPQDDGRTYLAAFPAVELSLTVSPAEPRTRSVAELKALVEYADALKALLPEAESPEAPGAPATASDAEPSETTTAVEAPEPVIEVTDPMSDAQITALEGDVAAIKSGYDSLNSKLEQLLQHMQDEPAVKNARYFTQDGGTADPGIKSFGDFLLSIKRGDIQRLKSVYGAVKDMAEGAGSTGGYLVPEQHHAELLQMATASSPVLSRVRRIPVTGDAGTFPALNQFDAPTAGSGNTAYAGGIVATNAAEGGSLTETQATFKEIRYTIHKVGGYTEVSNELVADSPLAIEALLKALFSRAVMAKLERHVIRGSGVGEPLGILNAPALVNVTPAVNNEFSYDDAVQMLSRYTNLSGASALWLHHPSVFPDIAVMESPAGGAVWQANYAAGVSSMLLGIDLARSEHSPQANNAGDVLLADFGAYLLFERQALSVAFSEHAAFNNDKGTWRFTYRCDGQPWVKGAVTLADPQGSYTVSPFVSHND